MEVDEEWYIVQWFYKGSEDPNYSTKFPNLRLAREYAENKRTNGLEAKIFYNAEISVEIDL